LIYLRRCHNRTTSESYLWLRFTDDSPASTIRCNILCRGYPQSHTIMYKNPCLLGTRHNDDQVSTLSQSFIQDKHDFDKIAFGSSRSNFNKILHRSTEIQKRSSQNKAIPQAHPYLTISEGRIYLLNFTNPLNISRSSMHIRCNE